MSFRASEMKSFWLFLLFSIPGIAYGVEVHFENKDSGFFLKHTPRPWSAAAAGPEAAAAPGGVTVATGGGGADSALLSVDRFTVLQTAQPAAVRATYGPFSTKQTVPARYSVPDPLDITTEPRSATSGRAGGAGGANGSRNATAALQELQEAQAAATHRLDVSAHAVTREIARDAPVLRVLFHAGSEAAAAGGGAAAGAPRRRPCVVLHATLGGRTLTAACAPDGAAAAAGAAGGGACLAQLALPASWWPPLPPPARDGKSAPPPPKQPPRIVKLSYSVIEPLAAADSDGDACTPRVQVQPVWSLGGAWLVGARAAYRTWRAGGAGVGGGGAALLLPRAPLYPRAKLHIPLVVRHSPDRPVTDITVKIRVKSAMRLFSATASSDKWSITAEVKARSATVTAIRREQPDADMINNEQAEEVLTFLAEVTGEGGERGGSEGHGSGGAGRLVWSVKYGGTLGGDAGDGTDAPEAAPIKATARFDIEKDDIQAVVPISKNWEVLNTAVLTGRQVSQAMKVLIVSQAGQVADVTLQSSCHSEDESVLKVSSSCSSVYVDGSEIRGSSNASVIVKYGTYTGLAKFTVWMPEFPLEVNVDDFRLSQIKGWKIPDDHVIVTKMRKRRSYDHLNWVGGSQSSEDMTNSLIPDKQSCRVRFQQSPVEVYARFLATDHDSGRVSYFVNRRTWLKVTDLVQSLLRVSDPRIASLYGRILQGRSTGRTEVQVLSPITGRVIGAREIRVGSDKVSITKIVVRVISGLQLNISPDSAIENGFISETTVTRRLTAQYQEGLLDIDIEFSDGTYTPLRDVAASDYYLMVESLDPEIVAFAPMVASHHPRVIAVGEGNGELLRVNLLVSEECRSGMRRLPVGKIDPRVTSMPAIKGGVLASALASVDVDFSASDIPQRPDTPQNDGIMTRGGMKGPLSDLHDILIGIPPLKDENNHEPTVQARQHNSLIRNIPAKSHANSALMTPVEIGMYVLLAAFCFAIVIFVVSCVVYASKFKPSQELGSIGPSLPMQSLNGENGKIQVAGLVGTTFGFGREKSSGESTTNAHDWVWLGRATIERHSNQPASSTNRSALQNNNNNNNTEMLNNGNNEMRITDNPLNFNYADPDDAIQPDNSVENVNERLCNRNERRAIDTTTYCKRPSRQRQMNDTSNMGAPPLPPHGVPLEGKPIPLQMISVPNGCEEYRPPVPPHRNIALNPNNGRSTTNRILADTIMPPTRRHSRQHRRERSGSRNANGNNGNFRDSIQSVVAGDCMSRPLVNEMMYAPNASVNNKNKSNKMHNLNNLVDNLTKEDCTGMFEFDNDLPAVAGGLKCRDVVLSRKDIKTKDNNLVKVHSPDSMKDSGISFGEVQLRNKPSGNDESALSIDFVQLSEDNNGSSSNRSSPEVKQATIVGNPMFATHTKDKNTDDVPTESLGLDDLEMDYDQILQYFHNLKESNA